MSIFAKRLRTPLTLLCAGLALGRPNPSNAQAPPAPVTAEEASEIAVEAYVYAYPLLLADVSRQVMTNVEAPEATSGHAPVNQFGHMRAVPDATFTDVVRPNADTLYSILYYDVTKEPLVVHVSDSGGRYYLLPVSDLWTDVFSSPGKRTSGTGAQTFALVGPGWEGTLPAGVDRFRSPTGRGVVIGRTQSNGKADYPNVHKFQDGLSATPLSNWGKPYSPPKSKVDPSVSKVAPVLQVEAMDAVAFFSRFAELTKENPPHANDYPILARMRRIGIEPGRPFEVSALAPEIREALGRAPAVALPKIKGYFPGSRVNGWVMVLNPIGTYGTDYLKRASIAYAGLGANVVEDAIYPFAMAQADGRPFDGAARYKVHFQKDEIPPARAFWSLTMYDERQLFTDNPIGRYAIGDRNPLKFNADGSLDLFIQRESPGADRESNWLPAPKAGGFSMNLRLYWPKPAALDGTWKPPVVERVR